MVDCRCRQALKPGDAAVRNAQGDKFMMRNVIRGILGLILAAAATWLANWVTERIFGPEEIFEDA